MSQIVTCPPAGCQTISTTACVFYEGPNLTTTNINTNDSVEVIIQKLETVITTYSVSNQVDSVAGKIGDVILDVNDIVDLDSVLAAPAIPVRLSGVKSFGKYVNGDTVPAAATIQEQLLDIAQEVINPTFDPVPSFSVSLSVTGAQEVGASYSAIMTGNFNRGSILGTLVGDIWEPLVEQAPRTGAASSYVLDGTSQAGNSLVVNRTIVLGNNIFNGLVNYLAGPQPLNSALGNFDSALLPGSLSAIKSISGYYKYWIYSGALNSSPTTSSNIRAITNNNFIINKTFNVIVPKGDLEFTIYLKQTSTLASVLYKESSNANITNNFNETIISVNDASGTPVVYKKLTQVIGGTGYTANATYIITIQS